MLEGSLRPTGSKKNYTKPYEKKGFTYILFNKRYGTLYIGVTSNLKKRIAEHKSKKYPGFTQKYNVDKLGFYEEHSSIRLAIEREKKLKRLHRQEKIQLIESINPTWQDLFDSLS
ncbi:MAG: GIY-YIG nuclease family protein [Fibrobacter sp.]|uniref:GIY-YIG nuclease family protein n=1 Tax=Fibrobacter sp. TaxID=35828 RepID=UPI00344D2A3C|nr:GIY-YIG nuclease family protein [Fibrobacter sp.]